MTTHTLRLTTHFSLLLLACAREEPLKHDSAGITALDTAQDSSDTGAEKIPDRLPFTGSFSATISGTSCSGDADATIIGAINIAGNATCEDKNGNVLYATISGSRGDDGAAQGTVAIEQISAPWTGSADQTTLNGEFNDKIAQGSFSMKADKNK